jgi:hypothetical protein
MTPGAPIVDNMVLAMFVDSGSATLLAALGGGGIQLSPTILDPLEWPPQAGVQPQSEFVKGMARFAGLGDAAHQPRLAERERFLQTVSELWVPIAPTVNKLRLAVVLSSQEERTRAKAVNSAVKVARIDPGEAECAAIAISRSIPFWSDDSGMVPMLRALYPQVRVSRTCALLAAAVNQGLLPYEEALDLYEGVFKGRLGLRSRAALKRLNQRAVCILPT